MFFRILSDPMKAFFLLTPRKAALFFIAQALLCKAIFASSYLQAMNQGFLDCKNGEGQMALFQFRFAEWSTQNQEEKSQAVISSLLCLSHLNLKKSLHQQFLALKRLETIDPVAQKKISLIKALSDYSNVSLEPEDQKRFDLFQKMFQDSQKDQRSALWMGISSAVIPGLGQALQGNFGSSFVAFLLNGLLLGATCEFIKNRQFFSAGTSGLLFSIFYVSNIASATHQAQTDNDAKNLEYKKELRSKLFPELEF
jgi:hypothetical protein